MTQEKPKLTLRKVEVHQIQAEQVQGFFVGWPKPPSPETLIKILEQSYLSAVIINDETHQVVAFVNCISDGVLSCYIPLLEVLPDYQGQGLGSKLIRYVSEQCQDFYMLDILCDADVAPFYERLGFQQSTGVLRRNYQAQSGRPHS